MKDLMIDTGAPYHTLVGSGAFMLLPEALGAWKSRPQKIMIVTDSHVGPLYAQDLRGLLFSWETRVLTVPAGEEHKTPETLLSIVHAMAKWEMTRSDLIVALGGGVIGDMAGFASAIYQRGTRFIQCPTTLLSAVDASVGGKTAVDLPEGKNLIGAFHQPSLVICDTDTFQTLPALRISDGAAEMIKHAILADAELFDRMLTLRWRSDMESAIARNIEIKRSYVVADEHDLGQRQLLNFGHTIGHAVEAWSGYALTHGQAVAIGMMMEAKAAVRMGFSDFREEGLLAQALSANGLPVSVSAPSEEILRFAFHDKKRQNQRFTVAIPVRIGEVTLKELDMEAFTRYIQAGLEP